MHSGSQQSEEPEESSLEFINEQSHQPNVIVD